MVDRRRLRAGDSYTPEWRGPALAKQRASQYRFDKNREPFRTEQSPGTQGVPYGGTAGGGFGGFKGGLFTQQMRNQQASYDKARSESYRPETFKYDDSSKEQNVEKQRKELRDNMDWNKAGEYFKVNSDMSRGGELLIKDVSNLRNTKYKKDMIYSDKSNDYEYKYETDAKGKRRYPS